MNNNQIPNIITEIKNKLRMVDYSDTVVTSANKFCETLLRRLDTDTVPNVVADCASEKLTHAQALVLLELVIRIRRIIPDRGVARKRVLGRRGK